MSGGYLGGGEAVWGRKPGPGRGRERGLGEEARRFGDVNRGRGGGVSGSRGRGRERGLGEEARRFGDVNRAWVAA